MSGQPDSQATCWYIPQDTCDTAVLAAERQCASGECDCTGTEAGVKQNMHLLHVGLLVLWCPHHLLATQCFQ